MSQRYDPASSRHLVSAELVAALEQFPSVDFRQGLEAFRQPFPKDLLPPPPAELATVRCEERIVPGPEGAPDVRVLVYTPPNLSPEPGTALLNIHGGGYVLGWPEQNDPANRARALALGCIVVATSYRLAPETTYPGAVEDCYAALSWMAGNAGELGIDPARIAISGESAGGGHAAALAIRARNVRRQTGRGPRICLQLLDSPMLDDRTGTRADPHPYTGEFVWTANHNRYGWRALLGREPGGADVPEEAVPARVRDLRELPPALIVIGALDLFLEESLEYARRLSRAGVPLELHVLPGAYHGFGLAQGTPLVRQKDALEVVALKRAFGLE